MKFNVRKMKEIARPMTEKESEEMKFRTENRDWLAMSAKFALLVRHILRMKNMTQTELAARMGVSTVQVSKLLSGKENIGLKTIAKVERALGDHLVAFPSLIAQDMSGLTAFSAYTQSSALDLCRVK